MRNTIHLGNSIDDEWADMIEGTRFDEETKNLLIIEYARGRDAQIGQWALRAESLDGLTTASRKGAEAKRARRAA